MNNINEKMAAEQSLSTNITYRLHLKRISAGVDDRLRKVCFLFPSFFLCEGGTSPRDSVFLFR